MADRQGAPDGVRIASTDKLIVFEKRETGSK
jgi:hypothetical protein